MPKQGMKRPETNFGKPPKNEAKPVPEIQGRAKTTKKRIENNNKPIIHID